MCNVFLVMVKLPIQVDVCSSEKLTGDEIEKMAYEIFLSKYLEGMGCRQSLKNLEISRERLKQANCSFTKIWNPDSEKNVIASFLVEPKRVKIEEEISRSSEIKGELRKFREIKVGNKFPEEISELLYSWVLPFACFYRGEFQSWDDPEKNENFSMVISLAKFPQLIPSLRALPTMDFPGIFTEFKFPAFELSKGKVAKVTSEKFAELAGLFVHFTFFSLFGFLHEKITTAQRSLIFDKILILWKLQASAVTLVALKQAVYVALSRCYSDVFSVEEISREIKCRMNVMCAAVFDPQGLYCRLPDFADPALEKEMHAKNIFINMEKLQVSVATAKKFSGSAKSKNVRKLLETKLPTGLSWWIS